jgi:hypothetical protein
MTVIDPKRNISYSDKKTLRCNCHPSNKTWKPFLAAPDLKLKQIYEMGFFDYDISSRSDSISPKRLILLFSIAVIGVFVFFALFVFPIQNLFRESISEQVTVISKSDGICVIDSQDHPRSISPCNYNLGDKLRITYKAGMVPIETHQKVG